MLQRGTLQNLNPEMTAFQHRQAELPTDILSYCGGLDVQNTFDVDPVFNIHELLCPENYAHLLPYFASPCDDPLVTLSPEISLHDDSDSYPYPKHQKCYDENLYHLDFIRNRLDGFVPNSSPVVPEFLPEFLTPLQEFQIPQVVNFAGNVDIARRSKDECVSAQSVAARQRRRKITEKTQELGKLIPGGEKMNTAEMFQAAFKYVKYLQAQVGILEFMGSIQVLGWPVWIIG